MKIIPTNCEITTAQSLKGLFADYKRDYYPIQVYQAILDFIKDTHQDAGLYELDVIAWCCDIAETSLDDASEVDTLSELVDTLQSETTILYVDESTDTVYHMAY